jgi:hypothetical protein
MLNHSSPGSSNSTTRPYPGALALWLPLIIEGVGNCPGFALSNSTPVYFIV